MKKTTLTLILCMVGLFTFANNASISEKKPSKALIKELIKAACTQTRYADVTDANGKIVGSVAKTYTVTSDDPAFICSIAGAIAQAQADEEAAVRSMLERTRFTLVD